MWRHRPDAPQYRACHMGNQAEAQGSGRHAGTGEGCREIHGEGGVMARTEQNGHGESLIQKHGGYRNTKTGNSPI